MTKTIKKYFLPIIGCVVLLLVGIYNFSSATFWDASFVDIITIGLAVFLSFYLTEKLNDERRRNDCIEHIIIEIEQMMDEDSVFSLDKKTLLHQRSCANRIKYLKDAKFQDIQEDIDFIAREFEEIRNLYSSHNQTEHKLRAVQVDFERHRNLICDKCNKIRVGLYIR